VNATPVEPDDLPLIGEPLPVEFANSLYLTHDGSIDFLATPSLIRMWFDTADVDVVLPVRVRRADAEAIGELRDGVRSLLRSLAVGATPADHAIAVINRCAADAPSSLRLRCDDGGHFTVTNVRRAVAIDAVLGQIASETMTLVAGPSRFGLRQCSGPGCAMLFVQTHHKRRWCHESCGHRARQAAYYRRHKARR
jgi:predicted RNA-binding Zn ribbon-like protein